MTPHLSRSSSPDPGGEAPGTDRTGPLIGQGAARDVALSSLTVRELIEHLARTEDQLNLARLRSVEHDPRAVKGLLRRQDRIVRELRRRHPDEG